MKTKWIYRRFGYSPKAISWSLVCRSGRGSEYSIVYAKRSSSINRQRLRPTHRRVNDVSWPYCSAIWSDSPSSPTSWILKQCRSSFAHTKRPARHASIVTTGMSSGYSATASSLSSDFLSPTESGAERAVRAGLDIIEAIARLTLQGAGRLQVRIGITSGMVVIASGERNAVGETINLAARLQTVAKPGSVVVSESVRRMAGGEFEYERSLRERAKGCQWSYENLSRARCQPGRKPLRGGNAAPLDADRRT